MENNTLCNRHSLGVNNHTKMYVTYTRIYGWSDYGGESSYQPGYRLENMMWMTLLVYDYIIPGDIKNIIDRLSYWLHLFPLLGKPGIIVTTTDTNGHKPVEEYLEHTVCLWGIDIILKENFYNTYSQQNIESRIEKIVNVINQMNFSKMPHFTSYQEAAFQNYKFAFSLNKETEEHRYWEENGLFCADSMEELYKLRIMQKKAEAIEKV